MATFKVGQRVKRISNQCIPGHGAFSPVVVPIGSEGTVMDALPHFENCLRCPL
jgi:hypothetical protein